MKKIIHTMLFIILVFSSLSVLGAEIAEDAAYYPYVTRQLITDYRNGKYGDEVYCFTIDGGWVSPSTIVITVKEGSATLVYTESNGERNLKRELTNEEYQSLVSYMTENSVDSLPGWDTWSISDGSWYYLTHISPAGISYVYINNPGHYRYYADDPEFEEYYADYVETYGDDSAYVGLVDLFLSFLKNGEFEATHSSGATILVPREEYNVQAVWKDGEDFRVCVKTGSGPEWRSFKDGAVGEVVSEPEGITLVDAWSDYPSDSWKHLNTYPWQCTWNGYRVRYSSGGLWLSSAEENPVKLPFTVPYAHPVAIPGTDFVVCTRATNGWTGLRDIVKINLVTSEETVLDFKPADYLEPVAMIGNELLVAREQDKYLWNPATDEIRLVTGDFTGLSNSYLTYRFLQKADGENRYYTSKADTKGKTVVGILDTEKFEFKPIATFNGIYMPPMDMWVDAENSVVYATRNGDLLELPFSMGETYAAPIKVRVNGEEIKFYEEAIVDNGHIHVWGNIYDPICAEGSSIYGTNASFVYRGKKILMFPAGTDYMLELDISGFDSIEALEADLAGSDITEKDYYRVIPLETTIIENYKPLRAMCEAFGAEVIWNGEENSVDITIDNSGIENMTPGESYGFMQILMDR